MKKRILSIVLSIVMLVSLLPTTALALETPSHTDHCVCGGSVTAGGHSCNNNTTWEAWDGTDKDIDSGGIQLTEGNWYLSKDVASTSNAKRIYIIGTVNLCLNGHSITNSGYEVIEVQSGATLNICDCKGNGRINYTGDGTSYSAVGNSGNLNIYSGALSGGRGIYNHFGHAVTIYGGSVSATGNGIYNESNCTVNIYGGTVIGGGYGIKSGTVNIYGGTVSGNTYGISDAKATISGGTVTSTGNDSYGISVDYGGSLALSGNPAITGGAAGIYLDNKEITIDGVLTSSAPIVVKMESYGTFTAGWNTYMSGVQEAELNKYFTPADNGYIVAKSGGELKIATTYTVTYDGNGATSGTAPVDNNSPYTNGERVTVLGNTGNLAKTGYVFLGWSKNADGTGTTYIPDNAFYIYSDRTLYAVWGRSVTGVKLDKDAISLTVGQTETLTATVSPDDSTNKAVSWISSDPTVAKVENGVVTALKPGSATITVTTTDGGKTATCAVTVSAPAPAHSHYNCGVESCNVDHNGDATGNGHSTVDSWTAWDGTTAFPGGNVYLTDDITLTEELTISGTVNLCLNGHSITNSATAAIEVSSGATLNICDCTTGGTASKIENTNNSTNSGTTTYGIYNSGTVNVYGGTISATTAATTTTAGSGSGIYNYSGQVTVVGTGAVVSGTFYGIYNNSTNGTVTVSGGTVSGEYGIYNKGKVIVGGEITVTGTDYGISNSGTVSISGGTVQATGSSGHGIYSTGGTVSVSGGTVQATGSNGRGIYNSGGAVSVSDGTVSGLTYGVYASGTGDITISGGEVSARNSASNSNSYGVYRLGSGAVEITGGTVSGKNGVYLYGSGNVTVSGGTVTGNGSGIYGYGIYLQSSSTGAVSVSGGTVSGTAYGVYTTGGSSGSVTVSGVANISGAQSGILHYGTGSVTVSGGTVQSPQRVTGTTSSGIKIITGSGNVTVSGGTVSGMDYGIYNGGTLTLSNAPTITGDTADIHLDSGKIITISGALTYTEENAISVKMDSAGTFTSGWTTNMGSAADNYGSYFTSKNEGYTVQPDSGELKIAEPPATETHSHPICGATCTHNDDHSTAENWTELTASDVSNNGTLSLTDGTSYYLGEDISVSASVEISGEVNLCLNGHVLKYDGTGKESVIKVASNATLSICDCTNTAHTGYINSGGLWEAGTPSGEEAAVTLTGGVITGGCGMDGGGVGPMQGTLNLYGGNIAGNEASGKGGGVYSTDTVNMYGGSIIGNTGKIGGGIYSTDTVNMYGGRIEYNSATGSAAYDAAGGGVYSSGAFALFAGNISYNTAKTYGGGVFHNNSSQAMTISGGTISNNTSTYGGGVYVAYKPLNMTAGTISNNTASSNGGGVYVSSTTLELSGTGKISGNKATNGGGVSFNGPNGILEMSGGEVSDNEATACGGGIGMTFGGKVTMTSGKIINNKAGTNGGGICYSNSSGTVTLSGTPQIKDNKQGSNNDDGNVYLGTGRTLTINGTMSEGASVGVRLQDNTGIFAQPDGTNVLSLENGYADKFKSDNAEYEVTVDGDNLKLQAKTIAVTGVTLNKSSTSITVGGTEQLTATVLPNNATNKTVAWSSNDGSIVTVDSNGNITAQNVGTTTITATAGGKTATCTVKVNAKALSASNVTLSQDSFAYDGSAKTPTVIVKDGDTVLTVGTDYTVSYSDNTNAGTGKVTVTFTGNYSGRAEKSFTISKADQKDFAITSEPNGDIAYGDSFTLSTTGGSGGGAVSWTVTTGSQYAEIDERGKVTVNGVGTVTITATKAESTNYKTATDTYTFTSVKATPTYTMPANLTATYGQTLANVSLTNGWSWVNDSQSVGAVGKKSFDATFTPSDTVNYKTVEVKLTVTVGKATPVVAAPTAQNSITYGAKLSEVGLTEGWTWVNTETVPTVQNDGFKAYYKPNDTSNYDWTQVEGWNATENRLECTVSVTVNAKQLTNPTLTLDVSNFTYDGGEKKPTVTVMDGSTTLTENTDYTITWPTDCTSVGTKTITVIFKGNYSGNKTVEYAIVKADSSCEPPVAINDLVYTGSAQTLVTAATPAGGTVQYSLSATGTFSDRIPTGTDAGTYDVYYKVIGDANHNDTAVLGHVQVTISKANQAAPVVGKVDETIFGKDDGKITGVTSAMEYRKDGTYTYTDIVGVEIAGLADGTYYVRLKGDSNHNPSSDTKVVIAAGKKVTVTFAVDGGNAIEAIKDLAYGDKVTAPTEPKKAGYTFAGWFSDSACTQAWNFDMDTVTANLTLYAKWSDVPVYHISGKVEQETDVENVTTPVANATVKLMLGTTLIATETTDENGLFYFGGQKAGDYNVVVTSGDKVVTVLVTLHDHDEDGLTVELPQTVTNSIVEHKPAADGKDSVAAGTLVGGLDAVAETVRKQAEQNVPPSSGVDASEVIAKVEVTLTVKDTPPVTNPTTEEEKKVQKEQVAIQQKAGGKQLVFFDLSVVKTIDNGAPEAITDTGATLLEIRIPFDSGNKWGITIYRYHGDKAEVLAAVREGSTTEGFWVGDDGYIHIYTKKFSTYAVGYTVPSYGYFVPITPDTVTSADTFDAGIVVYVTMSMLAAAGSAVVIGKKRKEEN